MKARQQAVITQREKELALGKVNLAKFGDGRHGKLSAVRKVRAHFLLLVSFIQGPISFNEDEEDAEALTSEESFHTNLEPANDEQCMNKDSSRSKSADKVDANCQDTTEADVEISKKKRRRLGKNPDVDTSFLPDIDRDEEEKRLRLVFLALFLPLPSKFNS